jgi:transcriptional regulator with XRE-family HTH domain
VVAIEPESPETAAQIVRRARGSRTLDEFADELGTSRQRVIDWEKGRSHPSERYAAMIAERAGVDPVALSRGERPSVEQAMVRFAAAAAALEEEMTRIRGEAKEVRFDQRDRNLLLRLRTAVGQIAEGQAVILRELAVIREQLEAPPSAVQTSRRRQRPA